MRWLRFPCLFYLHDGGLGSAPADEAGAAAPGDEAECPARHDEEPILEPDQIEEVHDEPSHPGREATDAYSLDVGDGLRATNRGQIALVEVPEGMGAAATEPVPDHTSGVAALLHRDGREPRQRHDRAVALDNADHVAQDEDLRVALQREVRPD